MGEAPSSASRRWTVTLVLVTLAAAAPAGAALWYEHYERGVALARDGRCAEALGDLDASARLGPPPQRRVRTYGTAFLTDYDPAYWRAACLATLGRREEARAALAAAERAGVVGESELAALRQRLESGTAGEAGPSRVDSRGSSSAGGGTPSERPAVTPAAAARPGAERNQPAPRESSGGRPGAVVVAPPAPLASIGSPPRSSAADLPSPANAVAPVGTPPAPAATQDGEGAAGPEADGVDATALPAGGAGGVPMRGAAPPPTAREVTAAARAPATRSRLASAALAAAFVLLAALALRGVHRRRTPRATRRLGGYDLLDELGRGGMATTWRGRRRRDGLEVAVKVPLPALDPSYAERFLREGRLGETLHHPNLVRIVEAAEAADGTPFLAMELLPGRTLRSMVDEHPQGLPVERALAIAIAIAEALDYAHGKGVVHRDLKPENVMLLPGGEVKVMDFGVARVAGQPGLTTSQIFLGSPLYAAPEAVDPRGVDARADLYSLGVLLFELLAGRTPFFHESVFRVLELHQRAPLPPRESLGREVPTPLWAVLARLLEKDPERRYASAEALLVDLHAIAADTPRGVPAGAARVVGSSP